MGPDEAEPDEAGRSGAPSAENLTLSTPRITGHALHENGLQRQFGDGTLVSSLERRAAVVPQINRMSTAGFVPPSV